TGFTRADDPTVMLRNPALLADLWDDQAMIHSHLLLQDSCFNPIGVNAWRTEPNSVIDLGDGPILLQSRDETNEAGEVTAATTDADTGERVPAYGEERFDEVCYQGPNTFLPSVALAVKLAHDLGVGLGFFPPDTMALAQFGNADGTVDTPRGKRPAHTRFFTAGSNRVTTYFSLMGGIGWRPVSWLRLGAAFQWQLVAFNTRAWGRSGRSLNPATDVRTDAFGRDLFIPGFIGSLHLVPFDALDLAVGFKWSERIQTNAKLDLVSGPWGLDRPFRYQVGDGPVQTFDLTPTPYTSHNQPGVISAPPIWSPQLSVGLRFADRLKPRPTDWAKAHEAADGVVEDHMATERWDIEVNGVYYFNSVRDFTDFEQVGSEVSLGSIQPDGSPSQALFPFGRCTQYIDPNAVPPMCVPGARFRNRRVLGGQDQYSVRVGADYNLFPGLFALRAGVSYETDGIDPEFFDPTLPDQERIGAHAGFTIRVAEKTDISFAYALFLLRDIDLGFNEEDGQRLPGWARTAEYGFVADPNDPAMGPRPGADGIARYEVSYESESRPEPGPFFANAGTGYYNLSILSASVTQHF
ncbi:MAG: outer membrane protein transport protein, partial [Myxococcales bacterium]|nr:outer membrane protein transport protein [Myxococcales bacterium]